MRSGTAAAFRIRAGIGTGGTTTFNGTAGARLMGGVINSYLRVTERMA